MKYLELEQLTVGQKYKCQTYDGDVIHLIYIGIGCFKTLNGNYRDEYERTLTVDGVIRYVLESVR